QPVNVSFATQPPQTSFALLSTDTLTAQGAGTTAPTTAPTETTPLNAGVGPADIAVAPMLNCFGSPGTHLIDVLKRAGVNPVLLEKGFSNQGDAREGTDAPVIAWGTCRNNTLVFSLELLHAEQKNASDPLSLTVQVPSASLGQDDSHAAQLSVALANYA